MPELASEYQTHDSEGIVRMRAACQLAARVLDYAGTLVRVRISVHDFLLYKEQTVASEHSHYFVYTVLTYLVIEEIDEV